ncbi:hypothetical protein FRC12_003462 [Ceratobasidium sp. 428]|nr:hypothetical protein FRC12_003462 [Ceratobasidium sp. 428]
MYGFNHYMSKCVLSDSSPETQCKALALMKRMVTLMLTHDHVELKRFYGRNRKPFTAEVMRNSKIVLKMARRLQVEVDETDCMFLYLKERARELGVDAEAVMARHKKISNAIYEVVVLCAFVEVARKYMVAIWECNLDSIDQEPVHVHPDRTSAWGGRRRSDRVAAKDLPGAHAPRSPRFTRVRPTRRSLMLAEDVKATPKSSSSTERRLLHPYSRPWPNATRAFATIVKAEDLLVSASLQVLQWDATYEDIESIPPAPAFLLAHWHY